MTEHGVTGSEAQARLYGVADRHHLWGPDRVHEAEIVEIIEATDISQLEAIPFGDELGMTEPRDEKRRREIVEPWWRDPASIPPRQSLDRDRHLFRGSVSASIAAGGRGKTTQGIAEAIQLACGFDLVTRQPLPTGSLRVWLVNGEEEQAELDRRTAAACQYFRIGREDLGGRLFVQSVRNTSLRLASIVHGKTKVDATVQGFFINFMRDHAIDVLFVDPLVSFHGLNESDNGAMDLLVKEAFGGIANDANAAVELLHHPGKSRPGFAETTVDDARGASSIIWACRSARVMNFMSTAEAKKLGVPENERRRHVRIANGKANNGPIGTARWIRLEVEKLANGDEVAVASPWAPSNPTGEGATDTAELARELATTGEYREDSRSPEWFGYAIAPHLKIDVSCGSDNDPNAIAKVKSIIQTWRKNNVLATEKRKDSKGKLRQFFIAGPVDLAPVRTALVDDEETV